MVFENPLFYLLPTPLVYPLLLLPVTLSLLQDFFFITNALPGPQHV